MSFAFHALKVIRFLCVGLCGTRVTRPFGGHVLTGRWPNAGPTNIAEPTWMCPHKTTTWRWWLLRRLLPWMDSTNHSFINKVILDKKYGRGVKEDVCCQQEDTITLWTPFKIKMLGHRWKVLVSKMLGDHITAPAKLLRKPQYAWCLLAADIKGLFNQFTPSMFQSFKCSI